MKKSKWIWYYGDFEIFHSAKLHTLRQEQGTTFLSFWSLANVYPIVRFSKTINTRADDTVTLFLNGVGRISIDGKNYADRHPIFVPKGKHDIEINVANYQGLPAAFLKGKRIFTDDTWQASLCSKNYVPVGCMDILCKSTDNVEVFPFEYDVVKPINIENIDNGVLYDFGKELFGKVVIEGLINDCMVSYGESREETLSGEQNAILFEYLKPKRKQTLRQRAFRYLYFNTANISRVYALYEHLPHNSIAKFSCNESLVNKVFDVSAYTLELCSREFFIDGIKRDRWVWSGDAYQSFMINRYLNADNDITKRTIIALLGKPPYEQHINTINDYTLYLIISIYDYYFDTADADFVKAIYPRVKALFEFVESRLDKDGFVCKYDENDWIFIDWANLDKKGPHCVEQILLWKAICAMQKISQIVGDKGIQLPDVDVLKAKIYDKYYKPELGGFIDGFVSGKNKISRQQNVFAIMLDFTSDEENRLILENVLLNDEIEPITTPYFKFYELVALCKMGRVEVAQELISSYWGGMIKEGATSIWEEYDPKITGVDKYAMYGNKFGKSLCHAWGSGPVCLLGKFVAGVSITSKGGKTYEVRPNPGRYTEFSAKVPIGDGYVQVDYKDKKVTVNSTIKGGTLYFGNEIIPIPQNK